MPNTNSSLWSCQECSRSFTSSGAARATKKGCPGCGSYDIDLQQTPKDLELFVIDDVLKAAVRHGFSFEITAAAVQILEDERRSGSCSWEDPLALLSAVRSFLGAIHARD